MTVLSSPTAAFGKLKGFFMKMMPIIGVIIGFFTAPYIMNPLASFIKTKIAPEVTEKKGIGLDDLQAYLYWLPTGLIAGGITGLLGYFARQLSPMLGNIIMGVAVGFFLYALYNPFSKEIGFHWWYN